MVLVASYYNNPDTQPLLYETISSAFNRIADRYPDHEALVVRHQGIRWTYSEYRDSVDCLALGLVAKGIVRGDRVAIWSPNRAEWCVTQFATAKIGAILACINPAYRSSQLKYALYAVQCKAIICVERFKSSDYLGILRELGSELDSDRPGELHAALLPHLRLVIHMGELCPERAALMKCVNT